MVLSEWIELANAKHASDLHLSAGQIPWVRVQGKLQPLEHTVCTEEEIQAFLEEVLNSEELERSKRREEVDTSFQHASGARVRVHAYYQRGLPSLAIRLLPQRIPLPQELNMPSVILEMAGQEQGLLLVTGPTGSGKSTTLASLIHDLNQTKSLRIVTLEDPIEYVHIPNRSMIEQRETGRDTASFARGIHTALRQDPDVIMIGELRDLESIQGAIRAAEAGRLVLATLHAGRAGTAVHRLVDVFPAEQQALVRTQLASVLLGVISQRLYPRKESDTRIAAFEVLVNTHAVANLIRSNQLHQIESLMQAGARNGMQTMETAIGQLIAKGWIDPVRRFSGAVHG
nr:PilT/PilU family type 4a pilus ATPase [Lihuaxuella thermophila]